MSLFKWTKNIKPAFPNVLERFFGNRSRSSGNSVTEAVATVPSVNILDKNKAFQVQVALPGLDKKDVSIEVRDQRLIISSQKQYKKAAHWMRREFGYAWFQRMFQIPDDADPDQVQASMKNGVLSIRVGKRSGSEARQKVIEVG